MVHSTHALQLTICRTHVLQLKIDCNFSFRGANAPLWSSAVLHTHGINTCMNKKESLERKPTGEEGGQYGVKR